MSSILHLQGAMSSARVWRQTSTVFRHREQILKVHRSTAALSPPTPASGTRLIYNLSDSNQVTWLHPGDNRVAPMIEHVERGDMKIGMILTFNSDQPLGHEPFYEALTLAYRKVKALRTCFREREGRWWYCHMQQPLIDFQVMETGTGAFQKTEEILMIPYNLADGPLWKVRLLPCPMDAPCLWPEVKEKFPYQNSLLFSFHHAAVDAGELLSIVLLLHQILDDIISGKPIDDKEFGQLVNHSQTFEIEQQVKANLEKNPEKLKSLLDDRKSKEFTPLIMQAFGAPETFCPRTEYLESPLIDLPVIKKFHENCRSAGITLNSGLVSVKNTALVELVMEAGLEQDMYTITSLHPVDLRRYMTNHSKALIMGFHTAGMHITMPTPYNARQHFWKYAKQLDVEFKKNLENKSVFENMILNRMLNQDNTSSDQLSTNSLPIKYDYLFSNLYAPKFPNLGVGKRVQLTEKTTVLPIHNAHVGHASGVASIRDKVRYEFLYSTRFMTRETAQQKFDKIISVFCEMAQ